jgi:predicted nucleic acid-binding protein
LFQVGELLLNTPRAAPIATRLATPLVTVHVPHLFDLEVLSGLRTLTTQRRLSAEEAARAVEDLLGMPVVRYPHDPLLARVWELRGNLTPYDAAYVALAEHLASPLLTCDARLAAAPGHRAEIELFA